MYCGCFRRRRRMCFFAYSEDAPQRKSFDQASLGASRRLMFIFFGIRTLVLLFVGVTHIPRGGVCMSVEIFYNIFF